MTDQKATDPPSELHTYDISTVCRLTGLTSANLRVWEKRYEAVTPTRSSSGRRQYSRGDLQRLTLLKTLIDLGHSISSSAKLPIAELERRIEESVRPQSIDTDTPRPSHACRICVIGSYLGTIFDNSEFLPGRAVKTAGYHDLASAEKEELPDIVDLLIVECPALLTNELNLIETLIQRTQALRSIVVYTYASSDVLSAMENSGAQITAVRAPVSPGEFKTLCETDIALANRSAHSVLENAPLPGTPGENVADRKFSERQLAFISQIATSVKCECPHQLVSLLQSLNGFEAYSLECENSNSADAEIHAYLHQSTMQARSIMEDALRVLLDFEGIEIES